MNEWIFLLLLQYLFSKSCSFQDYIHYQPFYTNENKKMKKAVLTRAKSKLIFSKLDKKSVSISY